MLKLEGAADAERDIALRQVGPGEGRVHGVERLHGDHEPDQRTVVRDALEACRVVADHRRGSIQLLHGMLEHLAEGILESAVRKAYRLCRTGRLHLDEDHAVIKDDEPVNAELSLFLRPVGDLWNHDRIRKKTELPANVGFEQIAEVSGELTSPL